MDTEIEMGELSDPVLWRRAAEGDDDAFGLLFERHARAIYNYCFRRSGDWSLAEDLMSVTFLVAWRRRQQICIEAGSALPWLYGIATNVLRNQRRSLFRYRSALGRLPVERPDEPDFADDVGERLDDLSKMRELIHLLEKLPRHEQDVIALCSWSQLSYEEAACALDIPVGTVRSRLSRGRNRLRELAASGGHELDVRAVPLPIEVKER